MSELHENCPVLLSVIREYGNCQAGYAQDCILTKVRTCSPYFQYREFDSEDAFKTYNSQVGCYSQVHEIDLDSSKLISDKVKTYALEIPICRDEMEMQKCLCDAAARLDLEARALRRIMDALKLAKEKSIWEEVLQPANFTAGNLTDLTGAEIDNPDTAVAANPLKLIRDIIASTCSSKRANWIVTSRKVAEKLIQSKAFLGEGCCNVTNPLDTVAALLGVQGICVADTKVDVSALGLPADIVDVFGDSILLYRRNDSFDSTDCPAGTFAFEAIYAPDGQEMSVYRLQGPELTWNLGLRGGVRIKAGYSSKIVYQYDLAHLITNVCI